MFDFVKHLYRQREFALKTFGPGLRRVGLATHIRKELEEIEDTPQGIGECEWIDVVILGLEGAMRDGKSPEEVAELLVAKQDIIEGRIWPDWKTVGQDEAIEHDRSGETGPLPTDAYAPPPGTHATRVSETALLIAQNSLMNEARRIGPLTVEEIQSVFTRLTMTVFAAESTGVYIPRLPIGTPIEKVGGYPFPGMVVSTFHTLAGNERFVVEATGADYAGMLHIFNGGQLRALPATETEGSAE